MSKNTVERTEGCHVVTMKTDPTVVIPKGAAVVMSDDYTVTIPGSGVFVQGVALELAPSGVVSAIPVLLAGPVLRVTCGQVGVIAGNKLGSDPAVAGEWIVDASNPAGFALEAAGDGDEVDICYVGEQY